MAGQHAALVGSSGQEADIRKRVPAFGVVLIALVVVGWAASGPGQRPGAPAHVPASLVGVLKIDGMSCAACAAGVRMMAKGVPGVEDVQVDSAGGTAYITYDPSRADPRAIATVITRNIGFKTEVVESSRKL